MQQVLLSALGGFLVARYLSPVRVVALFAVVTVLAIVSVSIAMPREPVERLLDNAYHLASRDLIEWAASYFEDAATADPSNTEARLLGGVAWYVSGKEELALSFWEEAERLSNSAASSLIGDALLARGDIEGAKAAYERALDKQPHAAKPLLGLALVAEKQGRIEVAIARLQEILESPEGVRSEEHIPMVEAYYHLGRLYVNAGLPDSALPVLRQGVRLSPYHGEMYLLLGQVYETQGAAVEAAHAYERSLQLLPGLLEAEEGLRRLHR